MSFLLSVFRRSTMSRMPVTCDVDPSADPDPIVFQNMIEKAGQGSGAGRPTGDARVEADRHQERRLPALFIKLVEGRLEIDLEIGGCPEAGGLSELSVIGVHRIRHDEMGLARDLNPIGQLVIVGVGIVKKAALFNQEPAGVFAGAIAAVPTERTLAGGLGDRGDCAGDALALFLLAQAEMLFPTPTVATDVIAGGRDR